MTALDLTDAQQEALCREFKGRRPEFMEHLMKMAFEGGGRPDKPPVDSTGRLAQDESIF